MFFITNYINFLSDKSLNIDNTFGLYQFKNTLDIVGTRDSYSSCLHIAFICDISN